MKPVGLYSDCVLIKRKNSGHPVMDGTSTSASPCQGPDKIMEKGKSVKARVQKECSEMFSRHDLEAEHSTHSSSGGHT